ncbi:MAG: GNAT family protein [Phycisphaerales bacterium]
MADALVSRPLLGLSIRLDPTTPDDASDLLAAAGSPETFRWFSKGPDPFDQAGMARHVQRLLDKPDVEPLTLRLVDSGRVIGMTSYLEIRPEHRGLEIGWTFIAPDQRGTKSNPEMKRLLLAHAFDTSLFSACGFHQGGAALRVALKTHHENIGSQRAIEKLGATREGVLRNHIVMPDGGIRHTVMYSITPEQWPAVREGLDRRLG